MADFENLGEGGLPWGLSDAPPELLWVRATADLNVGGHRLVRGDLYQVWPQDPVVAPLLACDPPWLLPLPGQGWGDTQQTLDTV